MALSCPKCHNKYTSFESCPQCEIPLETFNNSSNQHIDGNNHQIIQFEKDNHGPVINGSLTYQQPNEKVAEYDARLVCTYSSLSEMARPAILTGMGAASIGLLQWFGTWASILSFLGFTAPELGFVQLVIITFALILAIFAGFRLYDTICLIGNTWYSRYSNLYIKSKDGSIQALYVTGKCPATGCSGTLNLRKPFANEQGIAFAAICSKYGEQHAFEFNDETYIGSRIVLTPLKTNPTHY